MSLGNVLILLGMIGTGIIGIYRVGGQVQLLTDAIARETDLRVQGESRINDQVHGLREQQARDANDFKQAMTQVHDDVQMLVKASIPTATRR